MRERERDGGGGVKKVSNFSKQDLYKGCCHVLQLHQHFFFFEMGNKMQLMESLLILTCMRAA